MGVIDTNNETKLKLKLKLKTHERRTAKNSILIDLAPSS